MMQTSLLFDPVYLFNAFEVVLWSVLGMVAWWARTSLRWLTFNLPLALLLFAFAASDLIEMRTGAWWNPPSLFVLKAVCGLGLIYYARVYFRHARVA